MKPLETDFSTKVEIEHETYRIYVIYVYIYFMGILDQ